jgi:DNA-binding transcriptional MerR regulator
MAEEDLSIRELARRTGVPQPTLRTWEQRYGAPVPRRSEGGHRRYSAADVELVNEVLRLRDRGLSVAAAVAEARSATAQAEVSVFAGLRRRHAGLPASVVSKRTLLALTRAVEDECCAQATRPVLFAAFQRRQFYRESATRWDELARTARCAVVFADFGRRQPPTAHGPVRVHLPADAPLRREWLLVCDSPDLPACVVGWELPEPGVQAAAGRRFEVVWSLDPQVVRDAARMCARIAADQAGEAARMLDRLNPPAAPSADLARAERLFQRLVGYLDA